MSTQDDAKSIETKGKLTLSDVTGYAAHDIEIIRRQCAKGTNDQELVYFLKLAKAVKLNPLIKEIWCYKIGTELLCFAGRDGFLSTAQRSPRYNGLRSGVIRAKDEYSIDIPNGKIDHKITKPLSERGEILYGYAFAFIKDGEPTVEIAEWKTFNKGKNAWKTHPEDMIKKVAECHALKKAFGIHGLYLEEDFGYIDKKKGEIKGKLPGNIDTHLDNFEKADPDEQPEAIDVDEVINEDEAMMKANISKIEELIDKLKKKDKAFTITQVTSNLDMEETDYKKMSLDSQMVLIEALSNL